MSLKDFRLSVADHLIGVSNRPKKGRPSLNSSLKAKWKVTSAVRTAQLLHIPAVFLKIADDALIAVQK